MGSIFSGIGQMYSGYQSAKASDRASDKQQEMFYAAMDKQESAYHDAAGGLASFMLPQYARGFGMTPNQMYGQQNPNAPMLYANRDNQIAQWEAENRRPDANQYDSGQGGSVTDPMGRNRYVNVPAGKKIEWNMKHSTSGGSSPGEFDYSFTDDPNYEGPQDFQDATADWEKQRSEFIGSIDQGQTLSDSNQGLTQAPGAPLGGLTEEGFDPSQYGTDPLSQLRAASGVFGDEAQSAFFKNFQEDPGTQWLREQGQGDLNKQLAARGGLGGGSRLKALSEFNQGLANQQLGQRLNQLGSLASTDLSLATGLANMRTGLGGAQAAQLGNIGDAAARGIMGKGAGYAQMGAGAINTVGGVASTAAGGGMGGFGSLLQGFMG